MTTLTSNTSFTIVEGVVYTEETNLVLMPENTGVFALRELAYPDEVFPDIVYDNNPETTENFDSDELTAPIVKAAQTIEGNKFTVWSGYPGDRLVKEIWPGGGNRLSATAYFVRRLLEYWLNVPNSSYVVWRPKDRTEAEYYVLIEEVTVGGSGILKFNDIAVRNGYVLEELNLCLRIISEVPS